VPAGGDEPDRPERRAARVHRQWTPLARALALAGDRWTLLIILELAEGPLRLRALMERLPGASAGVLDNHVRAMHEGGLLTRARFREVPPRVEVGLTREGAELAVVAGALARWGMRNAWSEPVEGERVDVGAIVRMLPVLLAKERGLPDGTLEVVVQATASGAGGRVVAAPALGAGEARRELFTAHGGALAASHDTASPTANAAGDVPAWVAALGPARDRSGIALSGSARFASAVLDALPRPQPHSG
jgi:DNA-binding HxlR family transcriptional regulator